MELKSIYNEIEKRIATLDFSRMWHGFHPFKFAVYNSRGVCLAGRELPKTDRFLANTAIEFEGEQTAIWQVDGSEDIDKLAAGIVHEMFHAFQQEMGERRFPNETQALMGYEYSPEYLQIKYDEDCLLAELSRRFSAEGFSRFVASRAYRRERYPFQYQYEAGAEAIEGTANYVEYVALSAINTEKAGGMLERLRAFAGGTDHMIPVRRGCYGIGALLILVCSQNGIPFNREIGGEDEILKAAIDAAQSDFSPPEVSPEIRELCRNDQQRLEALLKSARQSCVEHIQCDYLLGGYNIYAPRYYKGFIYSEYFLSYIEGEKETTLEGDFLFRLEGDRIKEIYRLK